MTMKQVDEIIVWLGTAAMTVYVTAILYYAIKAGAFKKRGKINYNREYK